MTRWDPRNNPCQKKPGRNADEQEVLNAVWEAFHASRDPELADPYHGFSARLEGAIKQISEQDGFCNRIATPFFFLDFERGPFSVMDQQAEEETLQLSPLVIEALMNQTVRTYMEVQAVQLKNKWPHDVTEQSRPHEAVSVLSALEENNSRVLNAYLNAWRDTQRDGEAVADAVARRFAASQPEEGEIFENLSERLSAAIQEVATEEHPNYLPEPIQELITLLEQAQEGGMPDDLLAPFIRFVITDHVQLRHEQNQGLYRDTEISMGERIAEIAEQYRAEHSEFLSRWGAREENREVLHGSQPALF